MTNKNWVISQRIESGKGVANIDASYGPYNSIQEALLAIPYDDNPNFSKRALGYTVGILDTEGNIEEYWWKKGLKDSDLEIKNIEYIAGDNITIENNVISAISKGTDLDFLQGIYVNISNEYQSNEATGDGSVKSPFNNKGFYLYYYGVSEGYNPYFSNLFLMNTSEEYKDGDIFDIPKDTEILTPIELSGITIINLTPNNFLINYGETFIIENINIIGINFKGITLSNVKRIYFNNIQAEIVDINGDISYEHSTVSFNNCYFINYNPINIAEFKNININNSVLEIYHPSSGIEISNISTTNANINIDSISGTIKNIEYNGKDFNNFSIINTYTKDLNINTNNKYNTKLINSTVETFTKEDYLLYELDLVTQEALKEIPTTEDKILSPITRDFYVDTAYIGDESNGSIEAPFKDLSFINNLTANTYEYTIHLLGVPYSNTKADNTTYSIDIKSGLNIRFLGRIGNENTYGTILLNIPIKINGSIVVFENISINSNIKIENAPTVEFKNCLGNSTKIISGTVKYLIASGKSINTQSLLFHNISAENIILTNYVGNTPITFTSGVTERIYLWNSIISEIRGDVVYENITITNSVVQNFSREDYLRSNIDYVTKQSLVEYTAGDNIIIDKTDSLNPKISASITDNPTGTIYVDSNVEVSGNGSKLTPYKDLSFLETYSKKIVSIYLYIGNYNLPRELSIEEIYITGESNKNTFVNVTKGTVDGVSNYDLTLTNRSSKLYLKNIRLGSIETIISDYGQQNNSYNNSIYYENVCNYASHIDFKNISIVEINKCDNFKLYLNNTYKVFIHDCTNLVLRDREHVTTSVNNWWIYNSHISLITINKNNITFIDNGGISIFNSFIEYVNSQLLEFVKKYIYLENTSIYAKTNAGKNSLFNLNDYKQLEQVDPITKASIESTKQIWYSTEEQVLSNYWINDNLIYQKTFILNSLPNNDTLSIPHNIEELRNVIKIDGYIHNEHYAKQYSLNFYDGENYISTTVDNTNIHIKTNMDLSSFSMEDSLHPNGVTIQYTKRKNN